MNDRLRNKNINYWTADRLVPLAAHYQSKKETKAKKRRR
jgi:hypothetical protein